MFQTQHENWSQYIISIGKYWSHGIIWYLANGVLLTHSNVKWVVDKWLCFGTTSLVTISVCISTTTLIYILVKITNQFVIVIGGYIIQHNFSSTQGGHYLLQSGILWNKLPHFLIFIMLIIFSSFHLKNFICIVFALDNADEEGIITNKSMISYHFICRPLPW